MGSRGADRRRYIVFRIEPSGLPRLQLQHALSRVDPLLSVARIIDLQDGHGVLQVPHTLKDRAVAAMPKLTEVAGVEARCQPIGSSGTVRRARARFLRRMPPGRPPKGS